MKTRMEIERPISLGSYVTPAGSDRLLPYNIEGAALLPILFMTQKSTTWGGLRVDDALAALQLH